MCNSTFYNGLPSSSDNHCYDEVAANIGKIWCNATNGNVNAYCFTKTTVRDGRLPECCKFIQFYFLLFNNVCSFMLTS